MQRGNQILGSKVFVIGCKTVRHGGNFTRCDCGGALPQGTSQGYALLHAWVRQLDVLSHDISKGKVRKCLVFCSKIRQLDSYPVTVTCKQT